MTPAFLLPWAKSFARELRLGVWNHDGLALFHRQGETWELLGGEEVADRLDVLGDNPQMWSQLRKEAHSWGGPVRFPNLGPDAFALRHRQDTDILERTDRSPFVQLPSDFQTYLGNLERKSRHELKRKLARAQRQCDGLALVEGLEQIETFLRLHRTSRPEKRDFMQDGMESFFLDLGRSLEQAGMLSLRTLMSGGTPLASVFEIRFAGVLHLYNSGYDPAHAALSPGLVLIARCLEHACREGLREYDFLRGSERYKYDLGGRDRPVCRLTWPVPV
jgi:hypothetical protein